MKRLAILLLLCLVSVAFATDRTSRIFTGIGTSLVTTYNATTDTVTTDGYLCSKYDRINVYVSASALVSTGIVAVEMQYSADGTNYFPLYILDQADAGFTKVAGTISAIGDYYFSFPTAGKYFRVMIRYVSGTSVTIDAITIEGKS